MDANLKRQIESDPRVVQLANSRKRGSIPGWVFSQELRQLGYDVPGDVKYTSGGGRMQAGAFEETTAADKSIVGGAAAGMTAGLAANALAPAAAATLGPSTPANIAATTAATAAGGPAAPAGIAALGGAGAGVGANIAKNAANSFLDGDKTSKIRELLGLGAAGAGLLSGMRTPPANKQIEELLGISTDRVKSSEPLFDALQAMSLAQMPKYTRGEQ